MVLSENIYFEGEIRMHFVTYPSFSQLLKNVFIHVTKCNHDDYENVFLDIYFFTTKYLLLDSQHLPTVNILCDLISHGNKTAVAAA